jgi:hypothetical protein
MNTWGTASGGATRRAHSQFPQVFIREDPLISALIRGSNL